MTADNNVPHISTINIPDATSISIALLLALERGSGQFGRRHHLKQNRSVEVFGF